MESLFVLLLVTAGALGRLEYRRDPHSSSRISPFAHQQQRELTPFQLIRKVNAANTSWKAGFTKFSSMTSYERSRFLGVPSGSTKTWLPRYNGHNGLFAAESFDAREKWSNCESIHAIHNQGKCGSCWAVSAAAAMSDHHCIASGEAIMISEEDVLSCTPGAGDCARGGYPSAAWEHWVSDGYVTEQCRPYTAEGGQTPTCDRQCVDGENYDDAKHYGERAYNVEGGEEKIKQALGNDGPLTATFAVYNDFFNYKEGVYQHIEGKLAGYHAVKLVGWGEESGIPYWIVANSWGTGWGEGGFFKMRRGTDDCGIETMGVAGGVAKSSRGRHLKTHPQGKTSGDESAVVSIVHGGWLNITAHEERPTSMRKTHPQHKDKMFGDESGVLSVVWGGWLNITANEDTPTSLTKVSHQPNEKSAGDENGVASMVWGGSLNLTAGYGMPHSLKELILRHQTSYPGKVQV